MVRTARTCFVPGCTSGYKNSQKRNSELGIRNESLFKAANEHQLDMWRRVIPRQDKVFRKTDVVCELHFSEDSIIRYFERSMPDGSTFKLKRHIPALKSDAIPNIFPNLPKYLTTVAKKRKPPKVRESPVVEKTRARSAEMTPGGCISPEVNGDVCGSGNDQVAMPDVNNILLLADVATQMLLLEQEVTVDFSVDCLINSLHKITLPGAHWGSSVVSNNVIFLSVGQSLTVEKTVIISSDLNVKVTLKCKEVAICDTIPIKDVDEVAHILLRVDGLRVCEGASGVVSKPTTCLGYLPEISKESSRRRRAQSLWCLECEVARKRFRDRERKRKAPSKSRSVNALKICRIQKKRLLTRVKKIESQMISLRDQCAQSSEEAMEAKILELPLGQQEAVRVCFAASKVKNPKGRRYPLNWVYECLLLRIKSRKAYEYLRSHEILALPSVNTLGRYIRKIKGAYGFQQSIFDCMKEKSKEMAPEDRRGTLLLDEMKLSMSVTFDKNTLQVNGFTDLGDHTPLHQKNERGDHALVMMFQPFRGRWVQALACFLSKGCASGTILHHLVMECIILLEQANFHVDVVTSDGAQWNRNMWSQFGIDEDNVSCGHPYNSSRRLWFASDFPHLVKNIRNFITSHDETWTPDGVVKLRHWDAVVEMDCRLQFQLKACPKLTAEHIHLKPYQKMNVARAFQFFGRNVAAGMLSYKDRHPALDDCNPSIAVIERVKGLISAMNTRIPFNALRKGSEQWRAITEFLDYLQLWEVEARGNGFNFLSSNTTLGLKVTLRSTLELLTFLEDECNYQYLMTARLNQDALEKFFGMMRSACGSNDHPDSNLFVQIFRLMCTYSLVKPPRGSSVSGGDVLTTLVNAGEESVPSNHSGFFQEILDTVVEKGTRAADLDDACSRKETDHSYCGSRTPDFVLSHFSGYVAKRIMTLSKCEACHGCLLSPNPGREGHEMFTSWQSEGHLTFASERLIALVSLLEEAALSVLTEEQLNIDTVFSIATAIEELTLPLIGCDRHCHSLTEAIVRYYICTRLHFACRQANAIDNAQREYTRLQRKKGKL